MSQLIFFQESIGVLSEEEEKFFPQEIIDALFGDQELFEEFGEEEILRLHQAGRFLF